MLSSCQRQSENSPLSLDIQEKYGPENKNNPYDSVGRIHNEVLEAVHQFIRTSGDTAMGSIKGFMVDYFRKYRNEDVAKALDRIPDHLAETVISDYRKVLFSKPWQPSTAAYLNQLLDTISGVTDISAVSLKKKIVLIEERVMADKSISFEDRRLLLSCTSLARHSAFYWGGILNQYPDLELATKKGGLLHALKRVAAFIACCIGDVSGGAYAYIIGKDGDIIADASLLSTATWGGLIYYNNW